MKTGIQSFQYVLDTRLRGYDEQTEFINRLYLEFADDRRERLRIADGETVHIKGHRKKESEGDSH